MEIRNIFAGDEIYLPETQMISNRALISELDLTWFRLVFFCSNTILRNILSSSIIIKHEVADFSEKKRNYFTHW